MTGELERRLASVIANGGVVGANGPMAHVFTRTMITSGSPHAVIGRGLDLVPGSVIDAGASNKSLRRLWGVLGADPHLVGLAVAPETCLILHQRFLDVLGGGRAHALVAGSSKRLRRVDPLHRDVSPVSQRLGLRRRRSGRRRRPQRPFRPRRLGDLLALSRSAAARLDRNFPGYRDRVPHVKKGSLVIVGGGGMPSGLLDRFIKLAGGPEAPLLFIPCEERERLPRPPRMVEALRRAGAKNVDWLHTKDRRAANEDAALLAKVKGARGIWFGGGRQWNFVDSYQNTRLHALMQDVLARGGVIGGSSAGASIQADYMARGNPLGNRDSMAEGYETGLGFLQGVAIDQHFTQRDRLPDMTALVDTYPKLLGIGLDEAAAIVVQGSTAEVVARKGRRVLFYDRRKPVVAGQPDYTPLVDGQRFDLAKRAILADEADAADPKKGG